MISTIVSRLVILTFGTLYPAYASYKAVRTKNVKEYVKWMMYWIVFALFTCAETFTDVFLSWFPFYYEIKIILVLWLLSPATKGSSILYRKFVHPMLSSREQEIDEYISKAKEQGYHTVLHLGQRGVNYATTVIMQTAIKGGGGIVSQLRKSYSLSDLTSDADSRADVRGLQERMDESSDVVDARLHRRRHSPRRSASGSSRVDMYFPEVDVRPGPSLGHVRSTEDVSSGYSSAEPLYVGHGQPPKLEPREGLTRTASVGGTSRPRTRTTRAGVATKKAAALPEDSEGSEESGSDSEITVLHYPINQKSVRTTIQEESNSSENSTEFIDTIGFPAENMAQKIKETVTTPKDLSTIPTEQLIENIQPIDSSAEVIEEKIENIHILEEQLIENIQPIDSSAEVIEEKIENIPISEEQNIKNIERDSSVELYEDVIVDKIEEIKIPEEQIHSNPDLDSSEVIYEDIVEDLGESIKNERNSNSDSSFEDTKEIESIKTETISTTDSSFEDTNETFFDVNKIEENLIPESIESLGTKLDTKTDLDTSENDDYETISLSSISQRGGRYNKHIAPGPPPSQDENDKPIPPEIQKDCSITKLNEPPEDLNIPNTKTQPNEPESLPIKATLVLKPGVIKKLGPATEDPNRTQIFVSAQTPQTKRKPKSKHDSPISRLMMLPKKIFGHHTKESGHSSSENLRKSWHEDTRSLTPVSVENYSKSDTEGSQEHLAYMPSDGKKSDSKLVLRTLSHSPKQYRRRNREERYFEDSD